MEVFQDRDQGQDPNQDLVGVEIVTGQERGEGPAHDLEIKESLALGPETETGKVTKGTDLGQDQGHGTDIATSTRRARGAGTTRMS